MRTPSLVAIVALAGACGGDVQVQTDGGTTDATGSSTGEPNTSLTTAGVTSTPADSSSGGADTSTGADSSGSTTGATAQAHLTVHNIGCDGSVVSEPAGIDCGETCEADFAVGTDVTLTAMPGAYPLREWKDGCFGDEATCELTLDADAERTAQFTDMRWMKALGGAADDVYGHGRSTTADAFAGVFIGGYYSGGVLNFGSPSGLPCVQAITAAFVNKLSAVDGTEQWHHCISTENESIIAQNSALGVDVEPVTGDVIASGYFSYQPNSPVPSGGVDFGGGTVTCDPDGNGMSSGMFLVRYRNNDGAHVWSKTFCTSAFVADAGSMTVDDDGNVYAVFDVGTTTVAYDLGGDTFDPDPATMRSHVAKYDAADGSHQWSVVAPHGLWTHDADADDSGVYVVGIGWEDYLGYIVKHDPTDGSVVWSTGIGGPGSYPTPTGVAITDAGTIAVSGYTLGPTDFGGGVIALPDLISTLFLATYDATTGALVWVKTFECDAEGNALTEGSVVVDGAGDLIMTAGFAGNCDLGGGAVASVGDEDMLLARYSPDDGSLQQLRAIEAANGVSDVTGEALTIDSGGHPFFVSHLAGTAQYCGDEVDTSGFDGIIYGSILP